MLSNEEQTKLTRVGKDTPMGNLLRHYWFPIAACSELSKGKALAVQLLGENLVLFQTTSGQLGLLPRDCPHRGVSLACGHVDDMSIRCPYHGWRFDTDGNCTEMPAEIEKKPSLLKRASQNGYHARSLGGLIFAYIGPSPAPELPRYDLYVADNMVRDIGYADIPCNWLQIMENSVDPTHLEWLHGHHLSLERRKQGLSEPTYYTKRQIEHGFDLFEYGIIKRRILENGSKDDDDWKIGHPLIFPCTLRVGANRQHRFQIRVPLDDYTTRHYWYSCYESSQYQQQCDEVPLYEVPWKDPAGNFITDFVDGGDIMAWVSQGPIADRTKEMLVGADKGIAIYRKLLFDQLTLIEEGKDPMGVIREPISCIKFEQEKNKFSGGVQFLAEAIEMSHVKYSPIKNLILEILSE